MSSNRLRADLARATDPVQTFREAYRTKPLPWQDHYLQERMNVVVLKGRQVGASTSAGALAIHQAKYVPGSLAVIVSPTQKQSQEITIRAKAGIRNVERIPLEQDSASIIKLGNGSRIMSLPGTATSIRGYSAQLLVVDEAAFVEEETWEAARALVATGGRVIVQSTPQGRRGWFFDLWQTAASEDVRSVEAEWRGEPVDPTGWIRYLVRSRDVETISEEFLAAEKLSMGAYAYKAEYEGEFLEAGIGLFSGDSLRTMTTPDTAPFFEEWGR